MTTSDPEGSLSFAVTDTGRLQRYRFGAEITDFLICRQCGVYLGATCDVDAARFGVVNLNAMQPLPQNLPSQTPMHYDGESAGTRVTRRAARWTPLLPDSV